VPALREARQREAVHHGAEHAHVAGAGAVHAAFLQLGAPEEVAAADDDGNLRTARDDLGDLPGHRLDDRRIDPDGTTAEHLAAELEEHSAEAGAGAVGAGPWVGHRESVSYRAQACPTSKRAKSLTVTPAASSRALTVFFGS